MIHGLLLLCLIDQFTVSVQQPPVFTVEVHESLLDAAHVEPVAESDYYVVMFTASYCGPCQNYKNSGKPAELKAAGYPLTYIDTQRNSSFYSGSIPKFWLCKDKKKVHEWPAGAVDPSTILAKIRELKGKASPNSTPEFFGRKGTSHENRGTLIDHMLEDGIHKGLHTRTSLESLSDSELVELHDEEHEKAGHRVKNGLWKP